MCPRHLRALEPSQQQGQRDHHYGESGVRAEYVDIGEDSRLLLDHSIQNPDCLMLRVGNRGTLSHKLSCNVPDRVLLHSHAGGSVVTSMHTDRKAIGHIAKVVGPAPSY